MEKKHGSYTGFSAGLPDCAGEPGELGTLPKQTIVRHFQAMFHIPNSVLKYLCAKYTYFLIHIGEKRLGTSEDTRDPQPPKEGEVTTPQPQDVEEGEVYEVGEIVTTTGDVDVVEEESHFTSASAHVLIGEIRVCNRDLELIKENINDVQKKMKNIIDVLGRI
ncbi:hypothetical protein AB205_0092800 [Aquarana catesbeiana]|uniref:Uncharacterized protein n=1 Tax=Aquarana catesbeiana TaxID=8400 RepID=A0A2G9RII1_AQUCT|nr:hypothetical protein AB205_0092800 [Aquarana catesbeiana]